MAENTGIEWTDATFNPWTGCTAISPACDHCYAKTLVERWGGDFAQRKRTSAANWKKPVAWNRKAAAARKRMKVFCASLADVFDNQAPEEWRAELWEIIRATPWLDWQLLTKRPQNIAKMLPADWGNGWANVWLGTTAENEEQYLRRWPHMEGLPAKLRFLSYEPAIGDIGDLGFGVSRAAPDWVICGGESGAGARPMHPEWAASVFRQCWMAGIPFFFKQWGEWSPRDEWPCGPLLSKALAIKRDGTQVDGEDVPEDVGGHRFVRVGKKAAGAMLNGREYKDFPVA